MLLKLSARYIAADRRLAIVEGLVLALAFLLLGALVALHLGLSGKQARETNPNVLVFAKSSLLAQMPTAMEAQLRRIPGVTQTARVVRFGGLQDDGRRRITAFAVSDNYFQVDRRLEVQPAAAAAWAGCRDCVLVGADLLQARGWRVGDRIAMQSDAWRQASGERDWRFQIAGFYRNRGAQSGGAATVYAHYDFLNDGRTASRDTVGAFLVSAPSATEARLLPERIDAAMESSAYPTWSFQEDAANRAVGAQLSDIVSLLDGAILVVIGSILVVVCNGVYWALDRRSGDMRTLLALGMRPARLLLVFGMRSLPAAAVALAVGVALASILGRLAGWGDTVGRLDWLAASLGAGAAMVLLTTAGPAALAVLRVTARSERKGAVG